MSSQSPSICLLRTSAIGDVTHVVPLVRTLQHRMPEASLTWVIGKLEHRLVGDMPGVDFVIFDKAKGLAGIRQVHQTLKNQHFDILLHMQVALRANWLSRKIKATRRIGYDRARSKDLHRLFINERIKATSGQHVLDALGSFVEPLGIKQTRVSWDIPTSEQDQQWAEKYIPDHTPTLVVSPSSSHTRRNWKANRYAKVIDHALSKNMQVLLTGGPSVAERAMADQVLAACNRMPVDLTGKDTLKKALALFSRAQMILTPDSGPMHMANAVGCKVIGLHAASNPDRSGPYSDRRWCVNRYDTAAHRYLGQSMQDLPWGKKIEHDGVMDLITVDDVIERFEALAHHQCIF